MDHDWEKEHIDNDIGHYKFLCKCCGLICTVYDNKNLGTSLNLGTNFTIPEHWSEDRINNYAMSECISDDAWDCREIIT